MTPRTVVKPLCIALLASLSVSATLGGSLQRQVSSLPEVSAPPGGTAVWIAKAMRLNGVPMTLKAFTSAANADEVLQIYERRLRLGSGTRSRRSEEGNERLLTVMAADYYITIRARDAVTGSEGTIAVSPLLANLKPDKRTMFPLPETSRVVSLQAYEDDGIEAEHISAISKRTPAIEARAFVAALEQRGWQLLRSEPSATNAAGYVIEAQRAAALAQITLQRAPRSVETTIMIVWRKA